MFDSLRVQACLGPGLLPGGAGHRGRPPCAPQVVRIQLRASFHVRTHHIMHIHTYIHHTQYLCMYDIAMIADNENIACMYARDVRLLAQDLGADMYSYVCLYLSIMHLCMYYHH